MYDRIENVVKNIICICWLKSYWYMYFKKFKCIIDILVDWGFYCWIIDFFDINKN